MSLQSRPDFEAWLAATKKELTPVALGVAKDAHESMKLFRDTLIGLRTSRDSETKLLRKLFNKRLGVGAVSRDAALETLAEFFVIQFYLDMLKGMNDRAAYQRWLDKWIEDDARFKRMLDQELVDLKAESVEAIHEFWLFLLAVCRRLQKDENPITATDALHLGLIDEVIGLPGIPNLRTLVERANDPQ
jgi:hypothetical protein